jgi:hypothetical protein
MRTQIKFDKADQPYYFENGVKYYGCPGCGASFKQSCFCGMCNKEPDDEDWYIN